MWSAAIYSWDISTAGSYYPEKAQCVWAANDYIDSFTLTGTYDLDFWWFHSIKGGLIPGHHLGLLIVVYYAVSPEHEIEKTGLWAVYGAKFIDIYIE